MVRSLPSSLALCLLLGPTTGCHRNRSEDSGEATSPAADLARTPVDRTSPDPEATRRPPATIYRSEIQRATARGPAYLLRQLQPLPYRESGRFAGWEITRVFPDDPSLCGRACDLRVGDVIQTVNGSRLERPEQLSQLLEELPDTAQLTVVRKRGGQASTQVYAIAADPSPPAAVK